MDDLLEWLDAYELELAERGILEPIPKQLHRAWFQQIFCGAMQSGWYPFEDEEWLM